MFIMTFKEFLQITEDGQSSEQGIMVNKPAQGRKPSDGQPFAKNMSSFSGGEGSSGGGGPKAGAAFMKKMKKKMKSK